MQRKTTRLKGKKTVAKSSKMKKRATRKNKAKDRRRAKTQVVAQYRPFIDSNTGERIAGIFSGGKSDSISSKTPSLKRPDSDYSRLLVIVQEKTGLSSNELATEYNKRHSTAKTTAAISAKLGRLAAKKLVTGRPKPEDRGITLWYLYGQVV